MYNLLETYISSKDIKSIVMFTKQLKHEIDKRLIRLTIISTLLSILSALCVLIILTNYFIRPIDQRLILASIILLPASVAITLELKMKIHRLKGILSLFKRYEKKLGLSSRDDDTRFLTINELVYHLARKLHSSYSEISKAMINGNTQMFLKRI